MSLTKFRRRFPLIESGLPTWFETNELFEDDFFNNGKTVPAMNVKENEKTFHIELAIPGFKKEEIEVSLENDLLHVSGNSKKEKVEETAEGYTRKEFGYNAFDRKIVVPSTIDKEKEVKATYNNGILQLQLAKTKAAIAKPTKKILIK